MLLSLLVTAVHAVPQGTVIDNTAGATFNIGAVGFSSTSNTVSVTTVATPARISLLQYQPTTPTVNEETPSECRNGGSGPFIASPVPSIPTSSGVLSFPQPALVSLAPTSEFNSNEAIFIEVQDIDQNANASVAETIDVTVTSSNGDTEEVRLTETDINTGVFIGYVQSNSAPSAAVNFDCFLTVGPEAVVQASYVDPDDGSDTAAAGTLVDPFGIVFSSLDGSPINNVLVQLTDVLTGLPANVFAVDGVTPFPNPILTGDSFNVGGIFNINLPEGGYWFPLIAPGTYRLDILNSPNFSAPSQESIADLQLLPGNPFALDSNGSYGRDFLVPAGPPLHIDIPLDPFLSDLVVEKTASATSAAVGDFVQYRVTVQNVGTLAVALNTHVLDRLPQGFRYQAESVRLNDAAALEPGVSTDGRTLDFISGDLNPGQTATISYVAEVTAGAPLGDAINSAYAIDALGGTSNTAQHVLKVFDELMRERNTIVGRVIAGNCPLIEEENSSAAIRMQSEKRGNTIEYTVKLSGMAAAVKNYRLLIHLPKALHYVDGSSSLDGEAWRNPQTRKEVLTYRFDDRRFADRANWTHTLRFRAYVGKGEYGRYVTQARAVMDTEAEPGQSTPIAKNVLLRKKPQVEEKQFVFRPVFPTLDAELQPEEREQLDKIIEAIQQTKIIKVSFEGHADSRPVRLGADSPFTNNDELSRARAATVAPYFQERLSLNDEQIVIDAAGANIPLASNDHPSGQALNRRVDTRISAKVLTQVGVDQVVMHDSGVLQVDLRNEKENREAPRVGTELEGVAGVRVYLEDGTYVITDEEGKYHIEGVQPGTHVVQLDTNSLPEGMRVVQCEENTRFAGVPHSRFVDLQPGSLWRVDFHVEKEPPVVSQAQLQMRTRINGNVLSYRIDNTGGELPIANYRLTVILPKNVEYIPGSSAISGSSVVDPQVSGNILIYRLGDFQAKWDHQLSFQARTGRKSQGELVTKAAAVFDGFDQSNIRIQPVATVALQDGRKTKPKHYVFQPRFEVLRAELSLADKRELDSMIAELMTANIHRVRVVGHTDNMRISPAGRKIFADNYALSQARAATVADYLRESLGLPESKVIADGRGPDEPVATNSTAAGRSKNRRTEIFIEAIEDQGPVISTMLNSVSKLNSAKVVGRTESTQQSASFNKPASLKRTIDDFGQEWLEQAQPGVEWLMPAAGDIPEVPAVNVAIKHGPGDTIKGKLNGKRLNPLFFFGRKSNRAGTVARSYWQGVHIKDGPNKLEFVVTSAKTGEVIKLERIIHLSGAPVRAELVKQYSRLLADGRTVPVLAVRFYDQDNKLVRGGVSGEYEVSAPYESKRRLDDMQEDILAAYDRDQPVYEVYEQGIAYIELEPTTQSGKVELKFKFNNEREQSIEAWLKPVARDWIVVGLADAVATDTKVSDNAEHAAGHGFEDSSDEDGRIALFAKGNLNEDWLLTASVDSDKEESATGNGLFQTTDPDEFFTLYGDNTNQRYEAPSTEKLFVKVEREGFYTLFGDYNTGLDNTELSKFNRTVTGLKSELNSEAFSLNMFATETSQRFVRDEIRGDGSSGLYYLSRNDIVLNSETITIETRDRFHSQDIVNKLSLRRHFDYNIDYQSGSLYFKRPIMARDELFNPVYIVIEYESQTDIEDEITAGGRGQLNLADGDLQIGASFIKDGTFSLEGELAGMDAEYQLGVNSRIRLEYASSELDNAGTLLEGDAYLTEYYANFTDFDGRVYLREQEAGFGLGQQAGSETATRKFGFDGSYKITESVRLNSEVFHEEGLTTNAERDVLEVDLAYDSGVFDAMAGLRSAKDQMGDGTENESELLLLGAGSRLFNNKLRLNAKSELALDSSDANPDYPSRHILGAEYAINSKITTYIEEELTEGERQDTHSTRAGIRATPWSRAQIDSSVEQQLGEYGPRTFAVMGLTQGFRVTERLSADLAYDRAKTMKKPDDITGGDTPFNLNVPPASGTLSDDYTAVSTGLTYRADESTFVSRLEQRQAEREDKFGVMLGWQRKQKDGISYGFDGQLFESEFNDGSKNVNGNLKVSLAYRPIGSKWIHLNRFDYKMDKQVDTLGVENRTRKLINNWKGNFMPNRRHQIAFSYGVKYVLDNFDDAEYDGITQYLGAEYRFDLQNWWDIGFHASTLSSDNADNELYSYGLSTGFNLGKNIWLSVGYNFDGFKDSDFAYADYTAKGTYVKFRMKFDQDTFGLNK